MSVRNYLGPRGKKELNAVQARLLPAVLCSLQRCCPSLSSTARLLLWVTAGRNTRQIHHRSVAEAEHNPELITSGAACELILNLAAGLAAQCHSMFSISLCSSVTVASLWHWHVLLVICQYSSRQNTSTFTVGRFPVAARGMRCCTWPDGFLLTLSLVS